MQMLATFAAIRVELVQTVASIRDRPRSPAHLLLANDRLTVEFSNELRLIFTLSLGEHAQFKLDRPVSTSSIAGRVAGVSIRSTSYWYIRVLHARCIEIVTTVVNDDAMSK